MIIRNKSDQQTEKIIQPVSFQVLWECDEEILFVIDLLKNGGVIGYPTETVYGLGGDALNESVINKIVDMKGRKSPKPFLILVKNTKDVSRFVDQITPQAIKCMQHLWPGPCTLIFSARSDSLPLSIQKDNKIAIRVSPDPVCQWLMEHFPNPLVSTSANPENEKPATSADDVANYFEGNVDYIIDDGKREITPPSTILDVSTTPPRMLRQGAVSVTAIRQLVGDIHVT